MLACAALGFIAMGQTIALLTRRHRPVGRAAGRLPRRRRVVLRQRRQVAAVMLVLGFVADGRRAPAASGCRQRQPDPVRQVHPGRRDPGDLHRPAAGSASCCAGARAATSRPSLTNAITTKVGPVPVAFLRASSLLTPGHGVRACAVRGSGLRLRAVGSDEESARRVGVHVNRTVILGYVVASLFVALLGAVVLLAQLGIGDPAQGVGYTLTRSPRSSSAAPACSAAGARSSARCSAPA